MGFPALAKSPQKRPELVAMLQIAGVQKDAPLCPRSLLHVTRLVQEAQDMERWQQELTAMKKTQFSLTEVDKFRDLFLKICSDRTKVSFENVKELFRTAYAMGSQRERELMSAFYHTVGRIDAEADFPEFLMIMQKLIDNNFASCNSASETR